ncbi:hypothetical protein P4C99_10670 [Pontiellaceae bacterium B1224]|nr:hypothetical protein [Pontiellaceae bacterium B1224]
MKKTLATIICATIATSALLPLNSMARTKKNDLDRREVDVILEEIGGDHIVENMKVRYMCSLKFEDASGEDDYYHIYNGYLKKGGYRIIIFNNVPEYLGYYPSDWEGIDYEEGAILLDSGGDSPYLLRIPDAGPAANVRIDGNPIKFVENPKLKEEKKEVDTSGALPAVPKEIAASGEEIDYRDWKITMQGKEITVNAKFEKVEGGKVYIKNAKNGKVAGIPGSALSEEDQEYVKRITTAK